MMSAPAPYPMVQSSAPAPDDHEISTRTPSICVDYLSHNWTDEDVWSSWKAMTKRKNEIANGVRLENASWRTWAKQRGKLKTISPETLNWLKDSDVTWLYGPLHEHVESVPPPRVATAQEVFDLADTSSARTKSILKHRTISEMLTTPGRNASPTVENPPLLPHSSGESSLDNSDTEGSNRRSRPGILSVKSETAISGKAKRSGGGSPPASERLFRNLATGDRHDGIPHAEEKRHISFNQRVDQCIAVDVPDVEEDDEDDDDDEDEDSSDGFDANSRRSGADEASSSDDEMLTMKSSPRTANSLPMTSSSRGSSPGIYDTLTIAKLAPTMLKTSEAWPAPSPQVVDPSGFSSGIGPADGQMHVSASPNDHYYGDGSGDTIAQTKYSQWDSDDNFNGDFDYFNGPDVSDGYHATGGQSQERSHANETGMDKHGDSHVPAGGLDSNNTTGSGGASGPKSILKRRGDQASASYDQNSPRSPATAFSPPRSPEMPTSPPQSPSTERGRSQQRIASSASHERLQDAARSASSSLGRTRTTSNGTNSDTSELASSPPARSGDRRESFRGRSGEGSKAMQDGRAALRSSSAQSADDSDGRQSFDLNSPGIPDSPQLGDKDDHATESSDEAKLYGRSRDASKWADASSGSRGGASTGKARATDANDDGEEEPKTRLSVDLDNLPSNVNSPPSSAPGGPTPLNTPTFALARNRGAKQSRGGSRRMPSQSDAQSGDKASGKHDLGNTSIDEGNEPREPESPTLPRRSSATGALVAPSDADKDAGVRVPLAHDYVEEDEGGIVGRAVEIVNTARDLIGALLGTGSDRGRSWREGSG